MTTETQPSQTKNVTATGKEEAYRWTTGHDPEPQAAEAGNSEQRSHKTLMVRIVKRPKQKSDPLRLPSPGAAYSVILFRNEVYSIVWR